MNTKRVNSAAGVILAALEQGRVPAGIALALESAGLLMTPETADDMASVSTDAVRVAERSVSELRREHAENARLRERIAELEAGAKATADGYPPALPWARLMDDEDLSDFLDELAAAAGTPGSYEGALATVENAIATWRLIAEAQHAHNTAPGPDAMTRLLAPTQALREPEQGPALPWAQAMSDHDLHGFLDQLLSAAMGRWQHSPEVPDRVTLAEIEKVCALWRTPGEGNRLDGSEFDGAVIRLAPQAGPEQGACTECGDGPSQWCVGCAKCSCEPEHDKGCVKASAPR
ncbi:hypothetical protein [Streptomyces tendae]|uniref:hypothetical protein n=1 Tax=Streptomyces tendae TaxID=1932 RepID=UPI0038176E14